MSTETCWSSECSKYASTATNWTVPNRSLRHHSESLDPTNLVRQSTGRGSRLKNTAAYSYTNGDKWCPGCAAVGDLVHREPIRIARSLARPVRKTWRASRRPWRTVSRAPARGRAAALGPSSERDLRAPPPSSRTGCATTQVNRCPGRLIACSKLILVDNVQVDDRDLKRRETVEQAVGDRPVNVVSAGRTRARTTASATSQSLLSVQPPPCPGDLVSVTNGPDFYSQMELRRAPSGRVPEDGIRYGVNVCLPSPSGRTWGVWVGGIDRDFSECDPLVRRSRRTSPTFLDAERRRRGFPR